MNIVKAGKVCRHWRHRYNLCRERSALSL